MVIVLENAPPRLKGYLSRLFVEVRAGVFVGSYSSKTREKLWKTVQLEIEQGNAVLVWAVNNDAGYDFDTCGPSRRLPTEFDGLKLVQFLENPLENSTTE